MPDNILDVFSGDGFSVVELTNAIQMIPNQYGRIQEMGLFTQKPVSTTTAAVEIHNGVLNLLSSKQRGETSNKNKRGKRELRHFNIPHLPLDDKIYPSDIQNIRQFGSATLTKTPASETNDRLMEMSLKHDITLEYLMAGALKGVVLDANGDEILNIFEEFDVTEKAVNFQLTDDETKVSVKCAQVVRHIKKNLMGDTMTHVGALCSEEFFDALISHPNVEEAYKFYESTNDVRPLRDDVSRGFPYKGIMFEEYVGEADYIDEAGDVTANRFIPENTARFFPVGTQRTFDVYNAPADWMETANTPGLSKYAKVVPDQGGRFVEVLSESNPLPLCLRPKTLVKGKKS